MWNNPNTTDATAVPFRASATGMGGSITIRGPEVERVLLLDETTSRVRDTNMQLSELARRMEQYADDLVGPLPKGENGPGKMGGFAGRINGLGEAVSDTHSLVSALNEQFNRISRV